MVDFADPVTNIKLIALLEYLDQLKICLLIIIAKQNTFNFL